MHPEIKSGLAGCLWLMPCWHIRSVMSLQSWCQPGRLSSQGLSGAGGPPSKKVHSRGCRQEPSVPPYRDLSSPQASWGSSPHGSVWFPPNEWSQRESEPQCFSWYNLQSYTLLPPPWSYYKDVAKSNPLPGREMKPSLFKEFQEFVDLF